MGSFENFRGKSPAPGSNGTPYCLKHLLMDRHTHDGQKVITNAQAAHNTGELKV